MIDFTAGVEFTGDAAVPAVNDSIKDWSVLYSILEFFPGAKLDHIAFFDFNGFSGSGIAAFSGFACGL